MRKVLFIKTSYIGSLLVKPLSPVWAGDRLFLSFAGNKFVFEELCRKDYAIEFCKYLFEWRSKGWHHFHCFEPSMSVLS